MYVCVSLWLRCTFYFQLGDLSCLMCFSSISCTPWKWISSQEDQVLLWISISLAVNPIPGEQGYNNSRPPRHLLQVMIWSLDCSQASTGSRGALHFVVLSGWLVDLCKHVYHSKADGWWLSHTWWILDHLGVCRHCISNMTPITVILL